MNYRLEESTFGHVEIWQGNVRIGQINQVKDAERIVLCLNACAHLDEQYLRLCVPDPNGAIGGVLSVGMSVAQFYG